MLNRNKYLKSVVSKIIGHTEYEYQIWNSKYYWNPNRKVMKNQSWINS